MIRLQYSHDPSRGSQRSSSVLQEELISVQCVSKLMCFSELRTLFSLSVLDQSPQAGLCCRLFWLHTVSQPGPLILQSLSLSIISLRESSYSWSDSSLELQLGCEPEATVLGVEGAEG